MYPCIPAQAPADGRPAAFIDGTARTDVPDSALPEPVVPKLRGVPLILTWVVLAGAPWVAVWQVIKHAF